MRALALTLALAACADETVSGYAGTGAVWQLAEIDGTAVDYTATIRLPREGRVTGSGPCNTFGTVQTAPYPWFAIGPIEATERACPDLEAEQTFFAALGTMSLAEVSGDVLILTNEAGRQMVFRAQD